MTVRNILILILIFTVPACFTQNFVSSADQMKNYDDTQITSIQIRDGRVIYNSTRVRLYNSPKGIYVVDSSGTKLISHSDLKSIQIKQFDAGNTLILAACLGAATYLGMLIWGFTHLRITG